MERIWHIHPRISEEQAYLLIYEITSHLDRAGVSFHVPERFGFSPVPFRAEERRQLGEAVARRIIKADGKEYVPMTRGECLDRAVSLGLFPRGTDWNAPMTKGDAAVLAVRLSAIQERG